MYFLFTLNVETNCIPKMFATFYFHFEIFSVFLNRILLKSYDGSNIQNDLFHPENSRISHENCQISAFFKLEIS